MKMKETKSNSKTMTITNDLKCKRKKALHFTVQNSLGLVM